MSVCASVACRLLNILLLLFGDVEANPGPMSKAEAEAFDSALAAIRKLETGHISVLADGKTLKDTQETIQNDIKSIFKRVFYLESNSSPLGTSTIQQNRTTLDIAHQLQKITSRCEDSENRLRRSNLLFYGLVDDVKEDWTASEKKVIEFWANLRLLSLVRSLSVCTE